jgi:hypothetical protein
LKKLEAILGREYKSELRFVKSLEKHIGEVQALHYKDRILRNAWAEDPVDLLILIDDMDKINPKTVEKIFLEQFQSLAGMEARFVFALPLHLSYSPLFFHIKDQVDREYIRPQPIFDRNGGLIESAVSRLKEAVSRRLPEQITDPALNYLIIHSGGVLSDLMHLLQDVCKKAMDVHAPMIDENMARSAVADRTDIFQRMFDFPEYGDMVKKIEKTRKKTGISPKSLIHLLKYRFILEYGDHDESAWFDVHPYLKEVMKRFI